MNILEKELEDLIFENIQLPWDADLLLERGLEFVHDYDEWYRQVNLGVYGIADIIGIDYTHYNNLPGKQLRRIKICIVELKKDEINMTTYLQALKYCKALDHYIDLKNISIDFKIVLIGTSICMKTNFVYMAEYSGDLELYTTKIDLRNGITFKKHKGYRHKSSEVCIDRSVISEVYEYIKSKMKLSISSRGENHLL